jgi:alpha-galactosidase
VLGQSRLEVRNTGFTRFATKVGVNDSGTPKAGTVTFEVWGDGRLLATSPAMAFGMVAAPLRADIKGVRIVELVARGSTSTATQPVAWAEAALLR